ncbi:hypothetical protein [Clostridium thermobutyricum]|uniref:hypothetical protein n=1 Tax=Clostridium thermobutyricum TaxID=29372 RepID=UPI0018AB0AC8|nr:hypothetical protein [Clostridium thermobutyricum]
MANIQDEIQAISTAFYGAQVRSAIATGLDSINQEVDSLNSQVTKFDSLAQQMNQIVSEYNAVNAKMQNALQEVNSALKNELDNCTLSGTITNNATITGGTYKGACVEDTGINSCGISNSTLSGSIVNKGTINNYGKINGGTVSNITLDNVNLTGNVNNFTTITGGTYNNPTLSGKVNINDGLFNNGNPIVNASTLNVSNVHVQDNVTGTINLEYWALNAGLLSTTTNNLTCGIIKASITLDSNCTWTNKNPVYLNVEGFPNANAMTVTYTKNFVIGCGPNVIVLNGNYASLNANQTYTEYALIYG